MDDQQAKALAFATAEFLRIEPQNFSLKVNQYSDFTQHCFDSAKYGVVVSLMSFFAEGRITLDIALSELASEVSDDAKPILEQFLKAFRKIVKQFQKSVGFEIYCYHFQKPSVSANAIFENLTT